MFACVVIAALVLACGYHATLASLGFKYPWTTFLFIPEDRFNDWHNSVAAAATFNPYYAATKAVSAYFPVAYQVFLVGGDLSPAASTAVYLAISVCLLAASIIVAWRYLQPEAARAVQLRLRDLWLLLLACLLSYPVLFALDRGNIDLWIASLCLIYVATLRTQHEPLGFAALALAISLKAYPLAFFIATRPTRTRYLWLALVVIPLCTNLVIRTYAWMLLMSQQMPLAKLAVQLRWIPPDTGLYPSSGAVYVGMISSFLPFAVLPLYTSVERLDWSIVEAASDLYADRFRVFVHGILPQTLPGLTVAIILTFIPAMGVFVVSDLLGGAKYMLVGNLIQQQFGSSRDWPFGAAISLGLMLLTLAGLFVMRRHGREVHGA